MDLSEWVETLPPKCEALPDTTDAVQRNSTDERVYRIKNWEGQDPPLLEYWRDVIADLQDAFARGSLNMEQFEVVMATALQWEQAALDHEHQKRERVLTAADTRTSSRRTILRYVLLFAFASIFGAMVLLITHVKMARDYHRVVVAQSWCAQRGLTLGFPLFVSGDGYETRTFSHHDTLAVTFDYAVKPQCRTSIGYSYTESLFSPHKNPIPVYQTEIGAALNPLGTWNQMWKALDPEERVALDPLDVHLAPGTYWIVLEATPNLLDSSWVQPQMRVSQKIVVTP